MQDIVRRPTRFHYIGVRVSRVEKAQIQAAAEQLRATTSEYVRHVLVAAADRHLSGATDGVVAPQDVARAATHGVRDS